MVLGILPDTRLELEALVNLGHDSMDDYPRNWQAAQAVRLRDPEFQITVYSSRLSSVLPKKNPTAHSKGLSRETARTFGHHKD